MKTPLGTEVDLGSGHIVLDGVPSPAKVAQQPPSSAHVYCGHGRPSQLLLSSCSSLQEANTAYTRHRTSTEHSLTFRVRIILSYREVEASLLVGRLEFRVSFQHKYVYIRDEGKLVSK